MSVSNININAYWPGGTLVSSTWLLQWPQGIENEKKGFHVTLTEELYFQKGLQSEP